MISDKNLVIENDIENIFENTKSLWKKIDNNNIFLSGGTGFFGTWILKSFTFAATRLNLNTKIEVLTRNIKAHKKMFPDLHNTKYIKFIEGDIRSFKFPNKKFSFIIHAATTNAEETFNNQDPLIKYDTIVNGTKRILDFAKECKCKKFLYLSSGSCYGSIPEGINKINESYFGAPLTNDRNFDHALLGESKRISEMLTNIYSHKFKIETKIARCFSFVGPLMPLNIHYAIGNFIADIARGKSIIINGNGKEIRSYMYISDLVIWLLNILLKGKNNSIYNVGSEECVTIYKLAKKISKFSDKKTQIIVKNKNIKKKKNIYAPSTKKIRKELNLTSDVNLEKAIKKTLLHVKLNKKFYNI